MHYYFTPVALATAAVITFQVAPSQAGQIFNVNGTDFEVDTVTGTYLDLESTLMAQPFFGDAPLAQLLATAVGDALGFPNSSSFQQGPIFAYESSTDSFGGSLYGGIILNETIITGINGSGFVVKEFATAREVPTTAVPTPALLPGLLGMGLATLRKRKLASSSQA